MPATVRNHARDPAEDPDPFADLLDALDTPLPPGADRDDPFSDLDSDLETEDVLAAAPDDLGPVRDLFGTRPGARPAAPVADARRRVGGTGWPAHNYNDAYRTLQAESARRGGVRRRPGTRGSHELWDVDEVAGAAPQSDDERIRAALADAPPHASAPVTAASRYPGIPVARPWPTAGDRDPTRDADEWLDGLDRARPLEATVAQLVAGVPLHRTPAPLVDIAETLFARPRAPRHPVGTMRDVPAARDPPTWAQRALRITATIAVTLFGIALLQLLIVSLLSL